MPNATRMQRIQRSLRRSFGRMHHFVAALLTADIFWGRAIASVPAGAVVFFPYTADRLSCGLTGIVAYKHKRCLETKPDIAALEAMLAAVEQNGCDSEFTQASATASQYLGGAALVQSFYDAVRQLKCTENFHELFRRRKLAGALDQLRRRLAAVVEGETRGLANLLGHLPADTVDVMIGRLETIKDIAWCMQSEITANIAKINQLAGGDGESLSPEALTVLKQINTVLNSIDRLEVRGRDSAGISLLFLLAPEDFESYQQKLAATMDAGGSGLSEQFKKRLLRGALANRSISLNTACQASDEPAVSITFTYKVAAEVGSLGDNIGFLRRQIQGDSLLQKLLKTPHRDHTILSHTRWASVGAITEANCHPVDNSVADNRSGSGGVMHVCLNGDIDNYLELKSELEANGCVIPKEVTTDTKVIPLQIDKYLQRGYPIEEAFRLAVNDFEGSHAIAMITDLAPGKLFLAQKGSGQAIFIGIGPDYYMPASEVYGFVEETSHYLKLDGEKSLEGPAGRTQGQIFVLNPDTQGRLDGIRACFYDGTPVELGEADIKHTEITSRDIDRQTYPHYFLKEISESPHSVEKTLQNRWKIQSPESGLCAVHLDEHVIPPAMAAALRENKIRRVYFVGQGTAGVAAKACADILNYYLDDHTFHADALKASELSGFRLNETDPVNSMADALVVAISQSGTTTDTNRTVDMVNDRGAFTLAIVNRRDSDLTFKVDGVMYTSSGRDIEMSVASTKAFYAQIVAGALIGLYIAGIKGHRDAAFISHELQQLLRIPDHMRRVLDLAPSIEASARRLAPTKTYWAAVGSGPNKAAADEIRIKLSELCYKTISSDYVEDKKHIDLSSEPLIIVCAAGSRETVVGDLVKDTAIFKAHKAAPVVITDEDETRFAPYAADLFRVPRVGEHHAPILNTLVGHLWGYYAALAINEGSRFLYEFQADLQKTIDAHVAQDLDIYEVILEKSFKETVAAFAVEFARRKAQNLFPTALGLQTAADLTLLLKYLAGRLPVPDFEIDFGLKGTPLNMLNRLFTCLSEAINRMSRPVDAIKHQAKTVTVGTSRISEKVEGLLFDALAEHHLSPAQLITRNVLVLKNLQAVVAEVRGTILYRISGLNLLGEPTEETRVEIVRKSGILRPMSSRVETDPTLKGTKKIIVQQGNVYIGKGRKDDRSILIIPVISAAPSKANMIEYLLLLNIAFNDSVSLDRIVRALGGKHEHIKNLVQESSLAWDDRYLEMVALSELFGRSAEKIAEYLLTRLNAARTP